MSVKTYTENGLDWRHSWHGGLFGWSWRRSGIYRGRISSDYPDNFGKLNHTVETQNGRIMGFRYDPEATQYNGLPVNNLLPNIQHNSTYFLGIPYAAPPVGNLRWRAPANPVSWDDVLLADKTGPACAQKCDEPCDEQESSEDCLYLNVFVPNRAIDQKEKVAVAIWFHGGAFRWGQVALYSTMAE